MNTHVEQGVEYGNVKMKGTSLLRYTHVAPFAVGPGTRDNPLALIFFFRSTAKPLEYLSIEYGNELGHHLRQ